MSGTDYTLTPNLGLYKPNYDLDAEAWGYHLNANADVLDATLGTTAGVFLPLAGGAMSGPLLLSGDPTGGSSVNQAATKHYVDAAIAASGTYVDAPSDTFSYGRLNGTWTRVLPLTGGTLSGNVTLTNAAPTTTTTLLALNQSNLANGQYTILRLGQDGNTNYKSGYIAWLANATANLSRMVLGVRGYATGDILTMDGTGAVTFNAPTVQMINGELIPQRLNLGNANGNGLSQTISGALDHTTSPIWENYYFSGNNTNVNNQNFNSIIVNDSVNYTGNGQSNALYISQVSGAAATRAGGLWVQTTQSAAPTSPWRASTAITGSSSLSFNCGGTALTPTGVAGYTTTLNTYTSAAAGATFLQGLVGYEMDIHALAGSSLAAKTGLYIVLLSDDAVAGAFGNDSAIAFAAGAGSAHAWDYLLNLGGGSTQIPFKPTATLIGCFEPQTPSTGQALAAWGIDLSHIVFSNGFARSLGFMVDGSGNVTGQAHNMSNWSFTPSSTGLTVDVAGQRSSLPSIAAGGSNWSVGDKATTAYGGVYQITAVSAGVATAVTQLVPGVSASPPANPVATTATNATAFHPGGSGLTLNLTWTAANALSIQPSGGPTTFGGPVTVNTSPAFSGSAFNQSLYTHTNAGGTTSATGQLVNNLFLINDSINAPNANSVANVANYYTVTGGSVGARIAQQVSFNVTGNTADPANNTRFFQGLSVNAEINATTGGTSGNPAGSLTGANITASLGPNGHFSRGCLGAEIDVAVQAGAGAPVSKGGLLVALQGADAVDSTTASIGIGIGMSPDSPASPGFMHGISFGSSGGWWPINPTSGILIYADPLHATGGPAYTAATGIDFSAVTFSGYSLRMPGFTVDGSGRISPLLSNAANDAAAATVGVPIGAMYRNGNAVQVRLT